MGAGKFLRSLRPGDDRALAERDYKGQPSASDTAAAARRKRHRAAVIRDGDDQKIPRRLRGR
ncbi:hypothetical protein B0E38_04759 [Streptomyces sp. 111WW2]|uniref:hypothetical protein n=1 Tax=Streptomyces sp. 111WW2 TaxID=1945515 RepID=UPI000D0C7463|nr:hypothetical protein [Streptomyces sp. 111WW2]PSK52433.1 hypothetical protein B0E38_04759 [Streptomyces sp. 111WW2]